MKKRLYLFSASIAVFLFLCLFAGCYAGPSGSPATASSVAIATYVWTNAGTGDSGTITFYSDDIWYKDGLVGGYIERCKGTYTGNPSSDGELTIVRSHIDRGAGWFEAGISYSVNVSGGSFTDNGCIWTRQ